MSDLLLIGGGGHCRSCIDVIEAEGRHQIRGIVQQLYDKTERIFGYPVLGTDDDIPSLLRETPKALVAIGQIRSPESRIRLYELLKKLRGELPHIASPFAYCSKYAEINEGTIIMHGAILNAGVSVGANCIINSQALIEHDVIVSDHCHISTGAIVNGGVNIGKGSFIGSGAVLKEGIVIGENVIIGAGQVVKCDVHSGMMIKHDQ